MKVNLNRKDSSRVDSKRNRERIVEIFCIVYFILLYCVVTFSNFFIEYSIFVLGHDFTVVFNFILPCPFRCFLLLLSSVFLTWFRVSLYLCSCLFVPAQLQFLLSHLHTYPSITSIWAFDVVMVTEAEANADATWGNLTIHYSQFNNIKQHIFWFESNYFDAITYILCARNRKKNQKENWKLLQIEYNVYFSYLMLAENEINEVCVFEAGIHTTWALVFIFTKPTQEENERICFFNNVWLSLFSVLFCIFLLFVYTGWKVEIEWNQDI